jgi:hypothetical protein
MNPKLGSNTITYLHEGKKVEVSIPAIGPDINELMDMVIGYLKATGWSCRTIKNGLQSSLNEIEDEINNNGGDDVTDS